jgi:MFS family permease
VTGAVMTPIAGKLSDLYGKKKVLLVILAVYILGLLLGSLATTLLSLLAARVLQGIGISNVSDSLQYSKRKIPTKEACYSSGYI